MVHDFGIYKEAVFYSYLLDVNDECLKYSKEICYIVNVIIYFSQLSV